jgi:hypothetical protein
MSRKFLAKIYTHHRLILCLAMIALAACGPGDDHGPCS